MAVLLRVLLAPGVPGLCPPHHSLYLCLPKAFSFLPNLPLPPSSKAQPTLGQSSGHSLCTPGSGTQGGTGEAAGSPHYGRCPSRGCGGRGGGHEQPGGLSPILPSAAGPVFAGLWSWRIMQSSARVSVGSSQRQGGQCARDKTSEATDRQAGSPKGACKGAR